MNVVVQTQTILPVCAENCVRKRALFGGQSDYLKELFEGKFWTSNPPQRWYIQGVFFNWCPPKIHKYGKKLKYQNWCPPKNSKYQPVRKFWHSGLLWWDLLCNLTLRTFWGGTSWDLEIIGGHQFESSKHFTYRKTLTTFRGAPVKKNTLYNPQFLFQIFWDENLGTSAEPLQPSPATEIEEMVEGKNLPWERKKQASAQFSLCPRPH